MTFWFYATLTFFIVLCVIFALLILIQKGRGGGISSAFGGSGGNTAFGSKTGDVLTWATSIVFGIFLICCVSLSLLAAQVNSAMTGTPLVAPTASQTNLPALAVPATTQPAASTQPAATTPPPAQTDGPTTAPGAIVNPTEGK